LPLFWGGGPGREGEEKRKTGDERDEEKQRLQGERADKKTAAANHPMTVVTAPNLFFRLFFPAPRRGIGNRVVKEDP
jgi:hypothetical protein